MQWPSRVELSDSSLLLRPWSLDDVPRVAEICQDPEISRWTTVPRPYTEEHARGWIEQTRRDWERGEGEAAFAVTDADGGAVVGAIGLRLPGSREREGSVGYSVAAEARGCGVATGALRLLRSGRSGASGCGGWSSSRCPETRPRSAWPRRPAFGGRASSRGSSSAMASRTTACCTPQGATR